MTYHNSDAESFVMDDLGNRTGNQTLRGEGTVNFAVDTLTNRYTAINSPTQNLFYDLAGNLTQDHDGYRYVYDYENRITRIFKLSGQTEIDVALYAYDALGRRIQKVDAIASEMTVYYYSDNWQVLSTYVGGSLDKSFVFGNYIDEVLLMNDGTEDYFYLHDHLYSPVALLDDIGAVAERYEYDAYGKVQILTSNFSPLTSSLYGNPYMFTGRELDTLDSGAYEKMHYRHRDYKPWMGRFYQHDPKGYIDSLNSYQYVLSNPANYLDALGLHAFRFGSDLPPNGYTEVILVGRLIYDTVNPPRPYPNPYNPYVAHDLVGSIIMRASLTAHAGGFFGSKNARRFLLHFLSNSGSDLDSNYSQMINEDSSARQDYERIRNAAVEFVQKFSILKDRGTSIVSISDELASPLATKDWHRAIGGYRIAARGTNIKCNSMDLELQLRDYYDWDRLDTGKVGMVSPSELYSLHVWGKAQFYRVFGHHKVHLEWDSEGNINEK